MISGVKTKCQVVRSLREALAEALVMLESILILGKEFYKEKYEIMLTVTDKTRL